jgi:2-alkenal reductase
MLNKRVLAAAAIVAVLAAGCSFDRLTGRSPGASDQTGEATSTTGVQATAVDVVDRPAAPQPTATALPVAARVQFDQDEEVLVNLYERLNPAVVSIAIQVNSNMGAGNGSGSGFVIEADGYIVTNNHVVEDASRVDVIFYDGSRERAEVVGSDRYSDLALLKVDRSGLTFIELADSDQVKVGQRVIAIGNPFGLEGTMTLGIVSARGRVLPEAANDGGSYSNPDIIQTDAAINPGNSGGPLLDSRGRVIGVNTAIRANNGTGFGQVANSGIGFAVPSNTVKRVVSALREVGRVSYPYLGIQGDIPLNQVSDQFDLPKQGVMIASVRPGGPVDRAGLRGAQISGRDTIQQPGDVIVAFNGAPVRDYEDLIAKLVSTSRPGDTITLTIWRDGSQRDMQVTLGERPN